MGFSGGVFKLLGKFSPAWKFSASNSCSYFYSNFKHMKLDHHLSCYHVCKGKSYLCQLNDLSKTRRCWYTSSQTDQPFWTQNTCRGYITRVRNSFFWPKIFGGDRGEEEDRQITHLETRWNCYFVSILPNCSFSLFVKLKTFPWFFVNI